MKLSELIAAAGDENVKFQVLTESMTSISTNKKGISKITFGTDAVKANEFMYDLEKQKTVGFVIWIPKDKIPANAFK